MRDQRPLKAQALDPNITPAVFLSLAMAGVTCVLRNPAFDFLDIENPGFCDRIRILVEGARKMAANERRGKARRRAAKRDIEHTISCLVAQWVEAEIDFLSTEYHEEETVSWGEEGECKFQRASVSYWERISRFAVKLNFGPWRHQAWELQDVEYVDLGRDWERLFGSLPTDDRRSEIARRITRGVYEKAELHGKLLSEEED